MTTTHIGKPINRIDGRAKVTGAAKYAAEYHVPNLAYGVVVSSSVARGRITRIDAADALKLPGVLRVFTHENIPRLARRDCSYRDQIAPPGSPFRPLHDGEIRYSSQPVALVVADNFELARYAASLVRIEYERAEHATDLDENRERAYRPKPRFGFFARLIGFPAMPKPRGNAQEAFARAAVKVEAEYWAPVEHHNPMEPFATTVVRDEDGKLTVYDKTQGVQNVRDYLCKVFGLSKNELRVVSPFVGGAFGSGLRPQYQVFLAVLAARELKRSVRVVLTRQQTFSFGHRPTTWQRVALGAAADGTLEAILHEAISETSRFEDYSESVVNWSALLYQCDNVRLDRKVVQLDLATPIDMRAPGAAWGVYALECAMDELAAQLRIDPVELRLKNYADKDQDGNKPFSSKELRACYQKGAERFGWAQRRPEPRSMRAGKQLIGWGMATGVWETFRVVAAAKAVLGADGKLMVSSATADIGTGTYTIMTQIAAEQLGLPIENVTFQLGDSSLPMAPVEGGSFTAATVGPAVKTVCEKVRKRAFKLARRVPGSPLAAADLEDITFADGYIRLTRDPSRAVSIVEAMRQRGIDAIEERTFALPNLWKQRKYSRYAHSAVFAEVKVDEDLGKIEVTRVVSAIAAGRILNPKTARSQILGGIVWGIGMALEEESVLDHTFGRFMTHNLADYHVPVNADVHDLEVIFVEEHDEVVNPLGVKGVGELGIVGVAAAIANAVFHATGKRVRDLPITLDKLL
jgi:xanthine dehydrogenase YagR molybdenum-binding subunit